MRYILLPLFIIVSPGMYGQTQPTSHLPADKAATGIAEYERLTKYYRYYKQDSAIYYAEKGIAAARRTGDSIGVAKMLLQAGMINDNLGDFELSRTRYDHALELFETAGHKEGIVSATIRKGVVELRNGKYDKASKHFFEALAIAEANDNRFGVMEAYYSISWAHLDQKNYELALHYLKTAEAINDSLPFSSLSLNIFNHLGVVFRELSDYKKARYYLEKGVSMSNDMENQGLNITLINNLASVYSKEGNKEKAVALQKTALRRSRELGNYLRELQALYGLARTYGKERPSEAIHYLQQAIVLAREKKAYNQEIRYLNAVTPLYISQGKYKEAYLVKEREKNLADSFLYKKMSDNIASLKAEYELSRSNARIKELDLLDKKRKLELKNATLLKNLTFGGIGLLLIILILLLNRYKIKQRSNKEISEKNASLHRLVEEKEWLLKEVHHRVKNNLHTVISLLEAQSAFLKDDALHAVQNSQHRVYAMSLIHQKLYYTENITDINMSIYLPELLHYLRDSFGIKERIRFRTRIEPIHLDIAQAIPAGLILNEAITNAIKYAFPGNRKGEIQIQMIRLDNNLIFLSIRDNGIGLPVNEPSAEGDSLGFRLMKGLSEEIRGTFTVEKDEGVGIVVIFPENHFYSTALAADKTGLTAFQS